MQQHSQDIGRKACHPRHKKVVYHLAICLFHLPAINEVKTQDRRKTNNNQRCCFLKLWLHPEDTDIKQQCSLGLSQQPIRISHARISTGALVDWRDRSSGDLVAPLRVYGSAKHGAATCMMVLHQSWAVRSNLTRVIFGCKCCDVWDQFTLYKLNRIYNRKRTFRAVRAASTMLKFTFLEACFLTKTVCLLCNCDYQLW